MIWVAFLLGLFGSLHCIGMCGPIAIPLAQLNAHDSVKSIFHSLKYNFGRIVTYSILGFIFGLISKVVDITGLQSSLSIFGGIFLIILFILSTDIEKVLFKWPNFRAGYQLVQKKLSSLLTKGAAKHPFLVGLINGILPCGLVYLALAGALTAGSALKGAVFMVFFGLGTIPAMFTLMMGMVFIDQKYRKNFQKIYPILHLAFGILLIFRGMSGACGH